MRVMKHEGSKLSKKAVTRLKGPPLNVGDNAGEEVKSVQPLGSTLETGRPRQRSGDMANIKQEMMSCTATANKSLCRQT